MPMPRGFPSGKEDMTNSRSNPWRLAQLPWRHILWSVLPVHEPRYFMGGRLTMSTCWSPTAKRLAEGFDDQTSHLPPARRPWRNVYSLAICGVSKGVLCLVSVG